MKSLTSLGKLTSKLNPLAASTQQSVGLKAPVLKEQMSIEELGEKKFLKKQKYYISEGPHLWIARLLNQKGPMNKNQIWFEYQLDKQAVAAGVIPSKTYMKEKILTHMERSGKIKNLGYDKLQDQDLGYSLNHSKAFANTHPDVLLKLKPLPSIPRLEASDVVYRRSQIDVPQSQ